MEFRDLEYIALEGGGGKGVVYLGAIKALEKKCQKDDTLESEGQKKSLMDFKKKDNKELKIKGIAGASAGSITAFALALGLNSDDIEGVLNYPFANFLKEKDAGKYRMVGGDNKLYIAEDKFKKLGGKKKEFQYSLKAYQKVSGDPLKYISRNSLITVIVESIAEGLLTKVDFVQKLISQKDVKNWFSQNTFLFKMLNLKLPESNYLETSSLRKIFTKIGIFKLFQILLTKVIFKNKINKPLTLDIDTIGNLIGDRGMFSGVAVREFFYDLILFAITRDTYFQRQFLHWYYGGKDKKLSDIVLKAKQGGFSCTGFDIGKTRDTNYQNYKAYFDSNKIVFERLQCLTFKEFFEITNIHLGFNITNFSTDSPMLFSHKHTPDFPILEAVAASMSIPPAIKPLYSEAEVYTYSTYSPWDISVTVNNEESVFIDKSGAFELDDYYLFEKAIKKYLSEYNPFNITIDTNNSINNSNYLLLLRLDIENHIENKSELNTPIKEVTIENYKIQITLELLLFYYNAVYKGMFMDGGATCNIPYYYFREFEMISETFQSSKSIENVLALKLDNTFPSEWLQTAKDILNNSGDKYTSIAFLDKEQRTFLGNLFRAQFRVALFKNINKRSKEKIKKSDLNINKSLDELNKESWEKIAEEIITNNRNKKKLKPWEIQKSIFALISTIQYGSEDGQVRFLSDHNHIISLYSYGIGTYDFDMSKIQPLIKIAQTYSENKVNDFFSDL